MNRNAAFLVGAGGLAIVGVVLWRHSTQGTVGRMKAPFKAEIFPYTLKARHVSSPFNAPRKSGPHSGIDLKTLFAPMVIQTPNGKATIPDVQKPDPNGIPGEGLELFSPVDGKVVSTQTGGPGGNELIIAADDGTRIGFSHLHTVFVRTGDRLIAGETLALCGNTGATTGPHLHLTVRDNAGILVDPAPYLGL